MEGEGVSQGSHDRGGGDKEEQDEEGMESSESDKSKYICWFINKVWSVLVVP